jgi:hypothetical protein
MRGRLAGVDLHDCGGEGLAPGPEGGEQVRVLFPREQHGRVAQVRGRGRSAPGSGGRAEDTAAHVAAGRHGEFFSSSSYASFSLFAFVTADQSFALLVIVMECGCCASILSFSIFILYVIWQQRGWIGDSPPVLNHLNHFAFLWSLSLLRFACPWHGMHGVSGRGGTGSHCQEHVCKLWTCGVVSS